MNSENSNNGFSYGRVMAVAWRVLKQISRDRRTLGMMIIMPAVIMIIFGFALGGQVKNVPVLVDNQDRGYGLLPPVRTPPPSRLETTSYHHYKTTIGSRVVVGNFDSGKTGVDNGTYYASILIPSNFSESFFKENLGRKSIHPFSFTLMEPSPQIEESVIGALQSAMQNSVSARGIALDEQFAFGGVRVLGARCEHPIRHSICPHFPSPADLPHNRRKRNHVRNTPKTLHDTTVCNRKIARLFKRAPSAGHHHGGRHPWDRSGSIWSSRQRQHPSCCSSELSFTLLLTYSWPCSFPTLRRTNYRQCRWRL